MMCAHSVAWITQRTSNDGSQKTSVVRGFKSHCARITMTEQYADIAQWLERPAVNRVVQGSNPCVGAYAYDL